MCILFGLWTINLFSSTILQPATLRLYAVSTADASRGLDHYEWVLGAHDPVASSVGAISWTIFCRYSSLHTDEQGASISQYLFRNSDLGDDLKRCPCNSFSCRNAGQWQCFRILSCGSPLGILGRMLVTGAHPLNGQSFISHERIFSLGAEVDQWNHHTWEHTSSSAHFHLFSNFQVGLCFEANCTSWMTP